MSQALMEKFGGSIPSTREELQQLPGVGPKTANVILNIAFNQPVIAVDTHLFRVANRTGLAAGTTPQKVEEKLNKVVPQQFKHHAHHWLILHGRYTCKAVKPDCAHCLINDLCAWKEKKKYIELSSRA
jgi:endonuclease-3